jgi:hypothetical protein
MKRLVCLLLSVVFLGACSAHRLGQSREVYVSSGVRARLLPPSAFKGELSEVQEMRFIYGGAERTTTGVVKISPSGLRVIVLAGMVRILTLNYTSTGIECDVSPLLSAFKIEPEYLIFDVQLIYFPVDAINRALPKGMSFREEGTTRVLYLGEKKVASIAKEGGAIEFTNFERSYSYRIGPIAGLPREGLEN